MGVTISVDGIEDLQAQLDALPLYVRATILPPIYQDAADIVLQSILSKVPRRTGRTARELGMTVTQVFGEPGVVIRPEWNRVRTTGIVERGAKPHGGNPGFPGRFFFQNGVEETRDAALDSIATRTNSEIIAYWDKMGGGS